MNTLEEDVARHYSPGNLLNSIMAALAEAGADPDRLTPEDLKAVDEFHTGGMEATEALLDPLGIGPQTRVLDLGCGIGGTARHIAGRFGAHVTGVDLTPEYVETATALSAMLGLDGLTRFQTGSVHDLPVAGASIDLATQFHVGMNIADKPGLFAEVARVLAPGGRYALFDIMQGDAPGEIGFPVPWASTPDASFVAAPQVYRDAARTAGLVLAFERDRSAFAVDYFRRVIAAAEAGTAPHVGLHLLMGPTAQEKYGNAVAAAFAGVTAPWEMVFEKPR